MWKFAWFVAVAFMQPSTIASQSTKGDCNSYSVTHVYGSEGIVSNNIGEEGCCAKGEPGRPGKAGPPGTGLKGDQGPPGTSGVEFRNYGTASKTGCRCYFNASRSDCACCYPGYCACAEANKDECVPCGRGELCNRVEIPRSCEFINAAKSGYYLISPDPEKHQPFYAFCDFSSGERKTLINHDSLMEIEAGNCEPVRCYVHNVNYNANMNQIAALIGISENCTQFIKYRCLGSVLFQRTSFFATWVSRDGVDQRYWGGATSERDWYCACGETGTCTQASNICNCDQNAPPETSDEGYLTDKSKLPVTAVKFGDLGDSGEKGWHTIGALECSGRA